MKLHIIQKIIHNIVHFSKPQKIKKSMEPKHKKTWFQKMNCSISHRKIIHKPLLIQPYKAGILIYNSLIFSDKYKKLGWTTHRIKYFGVAGGYTYPKVVYSYKID